MNPIKINTKNIACKILLNFFLSMLDHYQVIKKIVKESGFEPPKVQGGGTRTLVVRPVKKTLLYVCLPY